MNSQEVDLALKEVTLIGLAGCPGCGKEFTGDVLLEIQAGYNRIIMSQLIERERNRGTGLGMLMKQYQAAGKLVPDEYVVGLFLNEVAALHAEGYKTIIADGFPRTNNQRDILKSRRARFIMFYLQLDEDLAIRRMLERGRPGEDESFCRKRQAVFREETLPMIHGFQANDPDAFIYIDATFEADLRARKIHDHVLRISQAINA